MGPVNYARRDQPIDIPFISKLDRKHCRMLVRLLTGHQLQYMHDKMRRAGTHSCGRCDTEKEMLVHIQRECSALEKTKMQTLGFTTTDPEQIRGEAE